MSSSDSNAYFPGVSNTFTLSTVGLVPYVQSLPRWVTLSFLHPHPVSCMLSECTLLSIIGHFSAPNITLLAASHFSFSFRVPINMSLKPIGSFKRKLQSAEKLQKALQGSTPRVSGKEG